MKISTWLFTVEAVENDDNRIIIEMNFNIKFVNHTEPRFNPDTGSMRRELQGRMIFPTRFSQETFSLFHSFPKNDKKIHSTTTYL